MKSTYGTLHAAFLVDTAPQFIELNRVAGVLQRTGWDVTFIFDSTYPTFQRDLQIARDLGYGIVTPAKDRIGSNNIRSLLSRVKTGIRSLLSRVKTGIRSLLSRVKTGIRSLLSRVKMGKMKAVALTHKLRAPNTIVANSVTPHIETTQKYFSVSTPRLAIRYSRIRVKRWQQSGSLRTLPRLLFDIFNKIIYLFPTINKWMWRVWLPYKLWKIRRSMHEQVRRSQIPPFWRFKFITATLTIRWTICYRGLLLQRRLFRAYKAIEGHLERPSMNFYSYSNLNPTAADLELLRLKAVILDHQELLLDRNIALLILAKDCAYYDTGLWVEAAKQIGIATALIPFDDADTKALAEHRAGHKDHLVASDYAKAVAIAYPEWVLNWGNECLMLLPPELVEARARLGLTPPNPWAYNSSRCDLVLVESAARREKMLAENAPAGQIVVTGTVFQDMLAENVKGAADKRTKLLSQLNLKDDKLLVLGSVTPNKISERPVGLDFSDYHDMLYYWISQITRGNHFNVILCLHPSVDAADVAFLEQHGAHIVLQDTASLIPLCDVYIVDCSATSRWALAASKLVLDYDVYRYDLAYHSKLPGIIHVLEKKDFEIALDRLAEGQLDMLKREAMSSEQSDLFGRLDGAASKRIEAACRGLIQAQQS